MDLIKIMRIFLFDSDWAMSTNTVYFKDTKRIDIDDEFNASLFVNSTHLITVDAKKILEENDKLLNYFIQY